MWSSFAPIKDILGDNLKKKGLHPRLKATLVLEEFTKIAAKLWDEGLAAEMKPLYIRNKVLTVAVLNSVLAQEINLRRDLILVELKRKFPGEKIDDIRVIF